MLSQLDRIKNAKIRWKTVVRWFLLIGSDRASKRMKIGGAEILNMSKNLRPRSKITCRLQTVFIRSDKLALLRQNVGSDLDPNCLALNFVIVDFFF